MFLELDSQATKKNTHTTSIMMAVPQAMNWCVCLSERINYIHLHHIHVENADRKEKKKQMKRRLKLKNKATFKSQTQDYTNVRYFKHIRVMRYTNRQPVRCGGESGK